MTKINQFLEPADPQTIHQIINELVEGEARELAKMVMDLKNPKIGWVYFIDVGQSDAGHEWAVWIKDDIFMVPRSDIVSNNPYDLVQVKTSEVFGTVGLISYETVLHSSFYEDYLFVNGSLFEASQILWKYKVKWEPCQTEWCEDPSLSNEVQIQMQPRHEKVQEELKKELKAVGCTFSAEVF